MREIKFRAWHIVAEKIERVENINLTEPITVSSKTHINTINDVVLMQYTGLLDKNGKEIYEGDIANFEFGKGVVYFDEITACIKVEFDTDSDLLWLYCCKDSKLEVIGNIYENKELIEDKNGKESRKEVS